MSGKRGLTVVSYAVFSRDLDLNGFAMALWDIVKGSRFRCFVSLPNFQVAAMDIIPMA